MKIAVYIHIPYCKSKCIYCDFLSSPNLAVSPAEYLRALEQELALRSHELREAGVMADTVYIGGGTPTVLSAAELSALLSACRTHLPLASGTEWTVEVNPGTIDLPKAAVLRAGGVNRISLGVQDTCDDRLALLGRTHTFAQARQAFSLCKKFFNAVSVDVMLGLPGQKVADSAKTVRELCAWQPDHLSLYGLKVEAGTRLDALLEQGAATLPAEEEALAMMQQGREILVAHGFNHYELANFAKPGHQCRHNLSYWENRPYLGLGLGAHSYWQSSRYCNTADLPLYQKSLLAGMLPPATIHVVQKREEMEDTMMLGLRLTGGVSFKEFQRRFRLDLRTLFAAEIQGLREKGLIECDAETIRLSKRGLPLANLVFAEFITGSP
ncbi:MAG: radical SAM family heme chaperone HemW [Dethiobacter sp.]|jgi:oxygen-independent coproporphyrinogen-3 oxidase|nr:radical SAM family heme chaperone HemW [Dethiobacter sp.]MCL4464263.1 radical SAM family heme chaperone HemW [Bacillota bacterium]